MSKLYDRAAEAVKKRNYDYAIELFIQELTIEPNNVEARRALRAAELRKFQDDGASPEGGGGAYLKGIGALCASLIHRIAKKHEKLMLDCEQFLKHAPHNASFLALLGDAARAAGHTDAAIVAYEELRECDRDSSKALRGLGQLWREKGDLPRSLVYYEHLKRVLPSDPEAAKAVRDLAAVGATRKVEDAKATGGEGSYRDIVKDKSEAERLELQSHRVRTESEADAAIKRLEIDLEKHPDQAGRTLKQIGDLHLRKKDVSKAIEAYERSYAVKKDPQVADALGDLKLRRHEEEVSVLAEAVRKGDSGAKQNLREAKDRRNKYAIEEFRRRVGERPTELALRFQLGQVLFKVDSYDEAIAELQKAASDPRRGVQARLLLGKCFAAKGMLELAIKELEKARRGSTSMDDTTKEVTYNLGLVLEKAGRKEDAASEFEKIVEVDIGYKDAMKRMEALKAKAG